MAKPVKKLLVVLGALASIVVVWAGHAYWVHVRYHGTVEEITFRTGDVTLNGWFVKPDGPGPHPAVVLLHGAGPQPGDGMPAKIYGNAFLRSGVAVLTYDKRGVGSSGGTFVRSRYRDFIEDGISAVRYLGSRSDVAARATVEALLEADADVNARDNDGKNALMRAAGNRRARSTVKVLLNAGADVNAKSSHGLSALIVAVANGQTEIVRALLDVGTDVNARANDGQTALMTAERNRQSEIAELLKKAGAKE